MELLNYFASSSYTVYDDTTTSSSSASTAIGTGFFIFIGILMLYLLVTVICLIITKWQLYAKAGRPGWAAIVPFYSKYNFGVISKKDTWMVWVWTFSFFIGLIPFGSIFTFVIWILLLIDFIKQYKASTAFWVTFIIFPIAAVFMAKDVEYIGQEQPNNQQFTPPAAPMGGNFVPPAPQYPQNPPAPQPPQNPQSPFVG